MLKYFFQTIFILGSFCLFSQGKKPFDYSIDLGMPIKINMILAGNFCEMRTNHFHTGIDIKTNKKEGYRLYAIEDGYIARIRVSPWGYGKAIYVQHNNGLTSVFAHCSKFPPLLDSLIYTIQKNQESVIIDEIILPLKIPVKRGEVIAYSGNSGSSSAPHLHFEIRETKTENPINPLLFDCYRNTIADQLPPEIRGIKLYALTHKGFMIPGKSLYFPVKKTNNSFSVNDGKAIIIDTLFTQNSVLGMGVYAIDKLDAAYNPCGIYTSELKQSDRIIHQQSLNYMDFDVNRYLNTHQDYFAFKHLKQHIHKQFSNCINPLPIYPVNNGLIDWSNATSNYEIKLSDVHSNTSQINFELICSKTNAKENPLNQNDYYFPNRTNAINMEGFEVLIETGQFYEPVEKKISSQPGKNNAFLSAVFRLFEYEIPVQSAFNIRIQIPDKYLTLPTHKMGIVLIDDKNRLYFQGGYVEEGWIAGKVRHFGKFTLMIDTIPPTIKPLDYRNNQNISKYSTLEFALSDNLSGIASYKAYINDEWVLTYYDRKKKRYIIPLNTRSKKHLKKGNNQLTIKVIDKVKNITEQSLNLIYQQ